MAELLVVGGGPAGMAAALFAKAAGAQVLLLEHNEKLGKKLYITGKGRCNVTNLCDREEFLSQVPRNPRFLYAAFSFLPPEKLRDWLSQLGCQTVVERGRRVFPASQKASDVTRALAGGLAGSEIRFGTRVAQLLVRDGKAEGVRLESGETIRSEAVLLATGGLSYQVTGSTGLGHKMAQAAGHSVTSLSPSLTGFDTADTWPRQLQGLTLKNVRLVANWGKKGHYEEQGELLFTHFGISGPLSLSLSSLLAGQNPADASVYIDLKPALSREMLRKRLTEEFAQHGRKTLASLMNAYLPASLAALFPDICGLNGDRLLNQVSGAEREQVITGLKQLPIRLHSHRPFSEAVVTRGGVQVKEVDPSTLSSKLVSGLYFAGELLDVDAMTGGYNLHIAFCTGALAGRSAAEWIKNK